MVGTVKLKKYQNANTTATAVSGDLSLWLPAFDEQSEQLFLRSTLSQQLFYSILCLVLFL